MSKIWNIRSARDGYMCGVWNLYLYGQIGFLCGQIGFRCVVL